MQERLRAILNRIKEFWNKFNKTQKILFTSILLAIIITIIILALVFSRTTMVTLRECSSASEATEVRTLLNDEGITCTISEDYIVAVDEADLIEAKLIMGSNNISADGYSFEDAMDNSYTTTEADKQRKYTVYLESKFEDDLENIDGIKAANVTVRFPESSSSVFSENEDASITAELTLTKAISDEQAEAIGLMLANFVGSENTNKVVVMDSNANLLYYGGTSTVSGNTASQKVQAQLEAAIIAKAEQLILATDMYTEVTVSPSLSVDFDEVEIVENRYTAPVGTEEGLLSHSYTVVSTGSIADASGAAGTESNDDDTTYQIQNADGSTSEYTLNDYDWLQDEVITTTTKASGTINYDESSVSIVAMRILTMHEEDAQAQGLLDDMTWEEYKAANSETIAIEGVEEEFMNIVSQGTGIDTDRITILGYQRYMFYDAEESSVSVWFILQIVLAVLIAALLVFIIIRSTRPIAVGETEPELSVEDMLATTREQQHPVEEIDMNDKSETRKAIEKFVDENPEAVALLLRNWLNEGW